MKKQISFLTIGLIFLLSVSTFAFGFGNSMGMSSSSNFESSANMKERGSFGGFGFGNKNIEQEKHYFNDGRTGYSTTMSNGNGKRIRTAKRLHMIASDLKKRCPEPFDYNLPDD